MTTRLLSSGTAALNSDPRSADSRSTTRIPTRGRFSIELLTPGPPELGHGPPVVLAHFRSRWGEVDGYLPVLFKLRSTHPQWRIIAMLAGDRLASSIGQQPFLYSELRKTVDVLICQKVSKEGTRTLPGQGWPGRIAVRMASWSRSASSWFHRRFVRWSHREVFRYLARENIKFILKDHGSDDAFRNLLQNRSSARCVGAPHGTGIFLEVPGSSFRKLQKTRLDLFLAGHESEIPCFESLLGGSSRGRIEVVGRPRYDQWWIDHLTAAPEFLSSEERRRAAQAKRTFLFATRGPSRLFFPEPVFRYLVRSAAEVVLRDPGHFLLIKPHPQQDVHEVSALLADWPADRWMISSFQTMQLATLADMVICMVSGVILDALAVQKPTVEFFQYTVQGSGIFQKDDSGKTVSSYTRLGLVAAAASKEELAAWIEDYFSGQGRSHLWEEQRQKAAAFLRLDNQSAARVVNAMNNL